MPKQLSKAVPWNLFGAPNVSTMSADGELLHGRNNRDLRSMLAQNMDILKLSHDCEIENDLIDVMSFLNILLTKQQLYKPAGTNLYV